MTKETLDKMNEDEEMAKRLQSMSSPKSTRPPEYASPNYLLEKHDKF